MWAFIWYITLYTILVLKWGVGAYMVMGTYKALCSIIIIINIIMGGGGVDNGICYIAGWLSVVVGWW